MAEHNALGKWGEKAVEDYLVARGYAIVERNWRLNHLEIDLVVSKGDEVAFVEVKTRRRNDIDPLSAINRRKILHLCSAADAYMRMQRLPLRPRFDVAAVSGDQHSPTIEYIEDAFRPPLRTYR